jgi:hypothetical protein
MVTTRPLVVPYLTVNKGTNCCVVNHISSELFREFSNQFTENVKIFYQDHTVVSNSLNFLALPSDTHHMI